MKAAEWKFVIGVILMSCHSADASLSEAVWRAPHSTVDSAISLNAVIRRRKMFLLFHTCIIKRDVDETERKTIDQYNINTSNRPLIYECDEYWMNVNLLARPKRSNNEFLWEFLSHEEEIFFWRFFPRLSYAKSSSYWHSIHARRVSV